MSSQVLYFSPDFPEVKMQYSIQSLSEGQQGYKKIKMTKGKYSY